MHVDIKVVAAATGVFAKEAFLISFVNGFLKLVGFVPEFASNVDISSFSSHAEPYYQSALHKLMRIVSQYFPIFARSWLRLIRVDYQVRWPEI